VALVNKVKKVLPVRRLRLTAEEPDLLSGKISPMQMFHPPA
jgi:hypothetical protein